MAANVVTRDMPFRTFKIKGLSCANCAAKIDEQFKTAFGDQAGLNFAAGKVTIPANQIGEAQQIIDSIEPGVTIETVDRKSADKLSEKQIPVGQIVLLSIAFSLFVVGLAFRSTLRSTPYSIAEYLVFLAAYALVGRNVIYTAVNNIAKGNFFDENFLMTLATAGAVALGDLPEAVGVMLFYYVGELFQNIAVNRSRSSIQALMDIRPDYANLKVGSKTQKVDPTTVPIGATIVVRPGERIPLDGEVLEGETFIDASALTGESVPIRVKPSEQVLAGSVNTSGLISVRVTKRFTESSLAKILDLVENATTRKSPTERFITVFSKYYTPVVVITAAVIALIPPLVLQDATFSEWVNRALILLVISCPCALVVSIPLGYFGGIGAASKHGILIKGANYLDTLVNVDTAVFDKTGTLTEGVFQVSEINPDNGYTADKLLDISAAAESNSSHPIALSIIEAYGKPIDQSRIGDYEEIAGHGLKVVIDKREVLVGNSQLMGKEGVEYKTYDGSGTVVYIAVGGTYAGSIAISDKIKKDAVDAINKLRQLGVTKTVMLTGDNQSAAEQIGSELRVDQIFSNLLPEDKVTRVEALLKEQRKGKKLAFIGDGINDAPVLTRSDVGIAMGGLGSDAAIEAADVVIMEDMPSKLPTAINIARGTRKIVVQNIAIALAIKGAFITLGAFGAATMWEAIFADVGVALIAILNATRALRIKSN